MNTVIGGVRVIAEDYLFEVMDENQRFNGFIGQCVSHFAHFVVPRRDQTREIAQDYFVPVDIDDVGGNRILLERKDGGNIIYICFWS